MEDSIAKVAQFIREAERVAVFTGAGVSTESGISDFRSPDGIWSRYDPEDFTIQRFVVDKEARKRNWQLRKELISANYQPNPAHLAIVELEKLGKLSCVITQNIDGLHLAAGNAEEKIIELHGTIKFAKCLDCDDRLPILEVLQRIDEGDEDPHCRKCGGLLKAATVSFGEAMPVDKMHRAEQCKRAGAKLVIVNYEPTDMDYLADVVIHAKAGAVMQAILEKVKA
jgi:NAD-dependent deacetylase